MLLNDDCVCMCAAVTSGERMVRFLATNGCLHPPDHAVRAPAEQQLKVFEDKSLVRT
jgi:hypothetical protein